MKVEISDLELVNEFRAGSVDAFSELITRYESKIFNLAMRYTRCQEDAEEVLQDVFTTLYRKLEGFEGKSQFSSWLFRITVNAAFMKLRKRNQHPTVFLEDLTKDERPGEDSLLVSRSSSMIPDNDLRDAISKAVGSLQEQYREVFILRDVDGMSNEETAETLNLSVPAVKSRLHRARMLLRKKLEFLNENSSHSSDYENEVYLAAA